MCCTCMPESCPSFLLVHWAFRACHRIVFHYCTAPPCHKINLFKRHFRGRSFERLDDAFVLLISPSSFTPRKSSFLSDDSSNSRMYSVRWFLLIIMPSGLWFQFDWWCFYYSIRNSLVALLKHYLFESFLDLRYHDWCADILFPFLCVCKAFVSDKTPFLRPSQPGSCAWLSPSILCATCVLVCVCICMCVSR